MKFWAEVEAPGEDVEATEDPTLWDVSIDSLDVITSEDPTVSPKIRFKVLRFVDDEPRDEESK